MSTFNLHGIILSDHNAFPIPGLRIEAWDKDLLIDDLLGSAVTDEKGSFFITFDEKYYRELFLDRRPDVYFKIFKGKKLLKDTSGSVLWNSGRSLDHIVIVLPETTLPGEPGGSTNGPGIPENKIHGRVTAENAGGIANLLVIATNRCVSKSVLLGQAKTDVSGAYLIRYSKSSAGNEAPDIEVRVINSVTHHELIRSAVQYKAPADLELNFTVSATQAATVRATEYERLLAALHPLLDGLNLKDLKEDAQHDQVTVIANKSGWDARLVAMSVQAALLAAETKLPAAHFYALFRSGSAMSADQLTQLSGSFVGLMLEKSVANRIIPESGKIADTVKYFSSSTIDPLLNAKPANAVSPLGAMLDLSLNATQKKTFVEAYQVAGGDADALWNTLKEKGFKTELISRLQVDGKLGQLTRNNSTLVGKLQKQFAPKSLEDLVRAGLYNTSGWSNIIGQETPAGVSADDYALGMATTLSVLFPTLVTSQMIRSGEVKLPEKVAVKDVTDFLDNSHGNYEIGANPVKTWNGFDTLHPETQSAVKGVERLFQMSPSNNAMATMSQLGLTSAYHVSQYTREEFMEKYSAEFEYAPDADLAYTKAREVHSTILSVATSYLTWRSMPNVYSLTGQQEKVPMSSFKNNGASNAMGKVSGNNDLTDLAFDEAATIEYPTLDELLGDMDFCACDHCKSVLSPAAYLVELLEFIDLSGKPYEKVNPMAVLRSRRPDIEHIQLSCENTNVALPYIDLVNEILEYYLVNGNLNGFRGHDMMPESNTNDLLADPQFVLDAAYAETKKKVYPYNLPFDYPLEASRLLFQAWDVKLGDGLRIFKNAAAAQKEDLLLNSEEYKTLTDITYKKLPEYFGQNPALSLAALNTAIAGAKKFATITGITNNDLVSLLETRFINPGVVLMPNLEKLQVSIVDINDLYEGDISNDDFLDLLPDDLNTADFGGDVIKWLNTNKDLILGLITLTDMDPGHNECSFADIELRYVKPDSATNSMTEIAWHKFHRFIRLWKKEGWNITTTDSIVTTFIPTLPEKLTTDNIDTAFTALLARIANFRRLINVLSLSEKKIPDWLQLWNTATSLAVREEQCAKLLKISVAMLRDLAKLSGTDPLKNDMEADDPSLLKFIWLLGDLKAGSLKVTDLNYLLRHQDESNKLTTDEATLLKNIKSLRQTLNAVDADLNMAPDNADLAFARGKVALVYDNSVTDKFFNLLSGSVTYSAALLMQEEFLPEKIHLADSRIGYDPFKKTLTYTGILSAAAKTSLDNAVTGLVNADVTVPPALAALKTNLLAAIVLLKNAGDADLTGLGAQYPDLKTAFDAAILKATPQEQVAEILKAILPALKLTLKTNALRQTLTGILKCDADITHELTDKPATLHAIGDNTKNVIHDFFSLENAMPFNAVQTYDFYLDVPATDDYLLYVKGKKDSKFSLTVNGQAVFTDTIIGVSGEAFNIAAVALTTGGLVSAQLKISLLDANEHLELWWRTNGMAKSAVPASGLYAKAKVDNARSSLIRLQKSSQLQRLLKLTPRELTHFAAVNSETAGILDALPVNNTIADAALHALWNKLALILYFALLKEENEPEENSWVQILEKPDFTTPQNKKLLLGITGWTQTDLDNVLTYLVLAMNDLKKVSALKKIKAAMDLVQEIGYPAAKVKDWSTDAPDLVLISDIKDSIRERTDDTAWLETMQSVNDPLRNLRRDALVSYILQYQRPSPEIETADKLYEYFLVDVSMDACMMTSRIRLALSTVQLFIMRCQMNLEPQVAASSIRSDRWEWMKRYRVWEANRKVFLYPENWLEGELRMDKSTFYRELEGELMQSDVTDDLAETTYLNYLKKLDEVARLEIVAMYLEEKAANNKLDDVLHVFGRSNGNTRQYYYRKLDGGYWLPWEKMTVNVEGDHLFPIIWKNRLFLFWINAIEKPKPVASGTTSHTVAGAGYDQYARKDVEINLCWAEYYHNKWGTPKSTDLASPLKLTDLTSFDPKRMKLYGRKEAYESTEHLIFLFIYENQKGTFRFTSRHVPPVVTKEGADTQLNTFAHLFTIREFTEPHYASQVTYNANQFTIDSTHVSVNIPQPDGASQNSRIEELLTRSKSPIGPFNLLPIRHIVENQWEAPFFYQDQRSHFYLIGDEQVKEEYINNFYYDPNLVVKEPVEIPPLMEYDPIPDPLGPVVNPGPEMVFGNNPVINVILTSFDTFELAGQQFGMNGKIIVQKQFEQNS